MGLPAMQNGVPHNRLAAIKFGRFSLKMTWRIGHATKPFNDAGNYNSRNFSSKVIEHDPFGLVPNTGDMTISGLGVSYRQWC